MKALTCEHRARARASSHRIIDGGSHIITRHRHHHRIHNVFPCAKRAQSPLEFMVTPQTSSILFSSRARVCCYGVVRARVLPGVCWRVVLCVCVFVLPVYVTLCDVRACVFSGASHRVHFNELGGICVSLQLITQTSMIKFSG